MSNFKDLLNRFFATNPKEVEGYNNTSFLYYRNLLSMKACSLIEIENIPNSSWDRDFIIQSLLLDGVLGVCETPLGVLPVTPNLLGNNYINFPTNFTVTNHLFTIDNIRIGINGELLYLGRMYNSMFINIREIIDRYAMLLAQIDGSLNTTLINSRLAHLFEAKTKTQEATLKKVYDDVSKGKPAVFMYNPNGSEWQNNNVFMNVKNTYIGNDLLITKKAIMNEFLTELGVPNANTNKRERLNEAEVSINNGERLVNMKYFIENLNRQEKLVNEMFGLNIHFKLSSVLESEDSSNEPN